MSELVFAALETSKFFLNCRKGEENKIGNGHSSSDWGLEVRKQEKCLGNFGNLGVEGVCIPFLCKAQGSDKTSGSLHGQEQMKCVNGMDA